MQETLSYLQSISCESEGLLRLRCHHCQQYHLEPLRGAPTAQSSSSSPPPPPSPPFEFIRLRRTRPGRPPPNGDVNAKSTCFSLSSRTRKDGMSQICFPTRMWRWRMRVRAWWIDLAKPSLKTFVCNLRSMIFAVVNPKT